MRLLSSVGSSLVRLCFASRLQQRAMGKGGKGRLQQRAMGKGGKGKGGNSKQAASGRGPRQVGVVWLLLALVVLRNSGVPFAKPASLRVVGFGVWVVKLVDC